MNEISTNDQLTQHEIRKFSEVSSEKEKKNMDYQNFPNFENDKGRNTSNSNKLSLENAKERGEGFEISYSEIKVNVLISFWKRTDFD